MNATIWVMEQELCDECSWLLGYFGECTNPGCIAWEGWDKWDEEDDDNPYYPDFGDYEERAYLAGEYGEEDAMNEEIPKPKDQPITIRLEWKPNDIWIGVYTRKTSLFPWNYRRRWQRDIWICMLPMLPIHLWWTRTEHENNDLAHRHSAE